MKILGIETSCDETAAAIVEDSPFIEKRILSNIIFSQLEEHKPYGGVVPEIAARAHLSYLSDIVKRALEEAEVDFKDVDAIAVTAGPGLIGGVLVGVMMAKSLAMGLRKPFIAVNHLEGHALTPRLTHDLPFPYLLLLASGGHCQFVEVQEIGSYHLLGSTIDDAAGEAFDKIAKLMGLDYPGGPAIEKRAKQGNPHRFNLPRPLKGREGCDLSFAGLKTAARILIDKHQSLSAQDINDMCASFQQAVVDSLVERTTKALSMSEQPIKHFVVAGGVAANQAICASLKEVAYQHNLSFVSPPLKLCTDNAAMIAWAGLERFKRGQSDDLSFAPRPRWPLTELSILVQNA